MAEGLIFAATLVSALGAGLIAGVFFAFSAFVMGALARLPAAQGIAAMQSINVVVLNPAFLGTLFGTAALCVFLAAVSVASWAEPGAGWLITGSLLYIVGTILVTVVFNVPLNNALAAVAPESAEGAKVWAGYLGSWTAWNHVRTAAALLATMCFILALFRAASDAA